MLLQKYGHIRQWVGDDGENGAAPACRGMTGSEWLMEKIAHELQDRDYYLILARRGGIGSRELFRMAAEEEHHGRRRKAMWFLAGGEGR